MVNHIQKLDLHSQKANIMNFNQDIQIAQS